MGDKSIVVTSNGHNKTIDKILFKLFEVSDAETYCNTINSLELKGDTWVFGRIVNENMYYGLEAFLPTNFSDVILKLSDRDIFQYGLRFVVDGTDREIIEKILSNLIAQEKDEYMRTLKTIQKEAVFMIQKGLNPGLIYSVLNSYTDISFKDDAILKRLDD